MNIEVPDELTREYQRASAAEAGLPDKATRDAILAEARKTALRRQPAANDSRYLLRAVAGVAVLGVAVLVWRQQDPRMPMDTQPIEYTVAAKAESATAEAPAAGISATEAPATEARESPAAAPPPPPMPAAANTASAERAEAPATFAEELAREAPRAAAPAMRSRAVAQSAADAETTADSASVTASSAPTDGNAILRRAFAPTLQNSITPPASAWVIRDAQGAVLRSGVVTSSNELTLIATTAQREFPEQQIGPWTLLPATTSSGRQIDVHVADLQ